MLAHRRSSFESLEKRLALAVTATVSAGDLVVQGDANGAVEITSVGTGNFEVRDNGVLIADSTTLTGVNDDIQIKLDKSAGADNTVTLNLGTQNVDQITANLGNGTNSFTATGGNAASLNYQGGTGADTVTLNTPISGNANVKLGNGANSLTVNSNIGGLEVRGGNNADTVTLASGATVANRVFAELGAGDNSFTLNGSVSGNLAVQGGAGADTVTLADLSSVGKSANLALGGGTNIATVAGTVGGSLHYSGLAGNDTLTIADTAKITDNVFASLGAGNNIVNHNGNIGANLRLLSSNINDQFNVGTGAITGGTTTNRLGLQRSGDHHDDDDQDDNEEDRDHDRDHSRNLGSNGQTVRAAISKVLAAAPRRHR
jgi:hypothetical protein